MKLPLLNLARETTYYNNHKIKLTVFRFSLHLVLILLSRIQDTKLQNISLINQYTCVFVSIHFYGKLLMFKIIKESIKYYEYVIQWFYFYFNFLGSQWCSRLIPGALCSGVLPVVGFETCGLSGSNPGQPCTRHWGGTIGCTQPRSLCAKQVPYNVLLLWPCYYLEVA